MVHRYRSTAESVTLPFRCGEPIYQVSLISLHKAFLPKNTLPKRAFSECGNFYYLAAGRSHRQRSNPPVSDNIQGLKESYEQVAQTYAEVLARSVDGFDAIVAIPTSEPSVLTPYVNALAARQP